MQLICENETFVKIEAVQNVSFFCIGVNRLSGLLQFVHFWLGKAFAFLQCNKSKEWVGMRSTTFCSLIIQVRLIPQYIIIIGEHTDLMYRYRYS